MPLDREIVILYEGRGSRNRHGEYVPGAKTYLPVWAGRQDKSLVQVIEQGGKRTEAHRTYRIRWLEELQFAEAQQLTVTDDSKNITGAVIQWYVLNIVEVTGNNMDQRRRFIDLELGTTT